MVKAFRPPRPSQWEAIRATDDHVLVVAGAGTGKTHTVVGRILYLLGVEIHGERCRHPVALRDIAAITFTNEAARDLKTALRSALRAAGRREDAWAVDSARIGTIHSFCLNILRENALRAGVSPLLRLLEEGTALELATQMARDTLVEALENRSVPGLDLLLRDWSTSDIDRWVVELMRKPDLVRELQSRLREAAQRNSGHPQTTPEGALLQLALLATERADATLRRENRIDFDRIILRTRDLLRDNADVRRVLQRRIHTLIIDEFQDVDPAQLEIACLLGDVQSRRRETTRLMLVGDPKQSIYRFRGADVSVWNRVERDFRNGCGRVLPLVENFRSVPSILAFVEATVGRMLDEPIDGVGHRDFEVCFQPVAPERAPLPDVEPIELLVVPPKDDGRLRPADEARDMEAAGIATRIQELHAQGVAYGDIAILLATWTNVERYKRALRRAGIPFYTLRREGFLDAREVHDLVLALEVLRDPGDTRALFGFLRSPFIGLRDETLLRVSLELPRPYWKHLDELDPLDPAHPEGTRFDEAELQRLARARELIERYAALRDRVPTAELLHSLLLETGYLAHLALLDEPGQQAMANVRQFLTIVRGANNVSTGDLIRVFREQRARGDRVAEAVLHAQTDDVVTITSIHVAKGLQWRTVFWADLNASRPPFTEKLVVTRTGIRLGDPDVSAKDQPEEWQNLKAELFAEEDAERKRLWYVAATRAMDRLVLSGIRLGRGERDSVGTAIRDLLGGLETTPSGGMITFHGRVNGQDHPEPHTARVRVLTPRADRETAEPLAIIRSTDAPPAIGDPTTLELPLPPVATPVGPPRHSATAFLTFTRCPRRHWFKYVAGIREPELSAQQRDELISAIQRGQIVHDVLERLEEDDELDELLEDAIGRWDEHAPAPDSDRGRRYREHLREEVASVANHPDYRSWAERPGARRELEFLYVASPTEMAHGAIDLAVPDPATGSIDLLDVKTTQCDAAEARRRAEHYSTQRDVYVTAAAAITGRPVSRFAFQFSRAQAHIATPIDAGEQAASTRRFHETAAAIASGLAPLTKYPHECRFCGYRRVRLCPGVRFQQRTMDEIFERLRQDRFRSRFRLGAVEREQLRRHGYAGIMAHAREFIVDRLAPAAPANDGRQTPWRGHAVFVAQHATATCCRSCLEKWYGISRGRPLEPREIDYVLAIIERWLRDQGDAGEQGRDAAAPQLDLF